VIRADTVSALRALIYRKGSCQPAAGVFSLKA
jgi:hypothetical protein